MKSLTTVAVAVVSVIALSPAAFAVEEYNTSNGLTAIGKPLGLHGVDPVTFLDLGNRISGAARFTAAHDGVAYYFSSQDAMEKFRTTPANYLPQNGGYCTFGVSVGKKFDSNPKFAAVINDKLYVFLNEDIFRMFQKDKAGTISKAAINWRKIRTVAASDL